MPKKPESRPTLLVDPPGLFMVAMILLVAAPAAPGSYQIMDDPVWVGLGAPADYTHLCRQDDTGAWICDNTCPTGSSSICAELTTPDGTVLRTCCISLEDEGGSDPFACLFDVQLIRDDDMPEEVYLG